VQIGYNVGLHLSGNLVDAFDEILRIDQYLGVVFQDIQRLASAASNSMPYEWLQF
jgi:hypothetical protein